MLSRKNYEILILILITLLMIGPAFFVFPIQDDYSLILLLQDKGIIRVLEYIYNGWTGRMTSTFIWSLFLVKMDFIKLGGVLFALSFVLTCKIATKLFPFKISKISHFNIFFVGMWFSMLPFFNECIFWITGGAVYIIPLLFFLLWIYLNFRIDSFENKSKVLLMFFFSIIVGLCHEQIIAMTYTIAGFFFSYQRTRNTFSRNIKCM